MKSRAWIIAVDMGHGHQRAADPLLSIAEGEKIVTANSYPGMPRSDRNIWRRTKQIYYFFSRLHEKGPAGRLIFKAFDYFQGIEDFYPKHESFRPSLSLKQIYWLIKKGWGRHLIMELSANPLPLVTTFFTAAFMAEYWKYPGPIFAVVTDSDVSRAWAPLNPVKSEINYFAPTSRVVERLKSYGVRPEKIIYSGFTLPPQLLGAKEEVAKENLRRRVVKLDPLGVYAKKYGSLLREHLGDYKSKDSSPVTLSFVIGGAGAQSQIGEKIIWSLRNLIKEGALRLYLLSGTHFQIVRKFEETLKKAGLWEYLNQTVFIISAETKQEYFRVFNETMKITDILWSKPSELSFYAALGIPLIIAPPIGSQEIKNREWLLFNGAALDQLEPLYTGEWLMDLVATGRLAQTAMDGFIKLKKGGTENIKRHIAKL